MKRSHLIQIAIIAVALICGYKAVESIVTTLLSLLYEVSYRGGLSDSFTIQYLLVSALYMAIFFVSIRFNRQIAGYIDKQGQAGATADSETIRIAIEQKSILFIVVVALCLITFIREIPTIILSIYQYFKNEVGRTSLGSPADITFKSAAVQFVFALIILMFAKPISVWLNDRATTEKLAIDSKDLPKQ